MTLVLDGKRVALEREGRMQLVVSARHQRSGRVPRLLTRTIALWSGYPSVKDSFGLVR